MVAKKKQNAAEGEIPKPKAGGWGKGAPEPEAEFDPSRVAAPGLRAASTDGAVGEDVTTAETHAPEGWQQPFRDGYSEEPVSPEERTPTPPTPKAKAKKPTKAEEPVGKQTNGELTALVERVERLMEEGAAIRSDIKEVMGEAKATGFDTATIRRVVAYRAKDPEKLAEQEALFDTYFNAVGGK